MSAKRMILVTVSLPAGVTVKTTVGLKRGSEDPFWERFDRFFGASALHEVRSESTGAMTLRLEVPEGSETQTAEALQELSASLLSTVR